MLLSIVHIAIASMEKILLSPCSLAVILFIVSTIDINLVARDEAAFRLCLCVAIGIVVLAFGGNVIFIWNAVTLLQLVGSHVTWSVT